jgi:hypothetical protein
MQTWLKTFRIVLLLAISLALLALAVIFNSRYARLFPATQAILTVQRGSIQITQADNQTTRAIPNTDNVAVSENESLSVSADGRATLRFTDDTSIELFAGSQLALSEFRQADVSTQVLLRLDSGQLSAHIGAQPDPRAQFVVTLPLGGVVSARQADFTVLVGHNTFVGALRGTPTLSVASQDLMIPTGTGVVVSTEQVINKVHLAPEDWAWVRVPLYKPDGSAVSLPITMTQDNLPESADYFAGESGDTLLMPGGAYKLAVALDAQPAYVVSGLKFPAGQLSEWPLTLGEIQFSLVDSNGKSLPTPTLLLEKQMTVPPDKPVLVGPKAGFNLARADLPDQTQYTGDLSIAPAQHLSVAVRADWFGTGGLQATIIDVDGQTLIPSAANVSIRVYKPGTEDSIVPPVGTLRSDGAVTLFPPGDYTVVVAPLGGSAIAMAARYSVSIKLAQTTSLVIKLGTLNVSYFDPTNNTFVPTVIYLAVAGVFKQSNLPIEQMATVMPLYSYNLSPRQTTIIVTAGDYAVQVRDRRAPPLKIYTVPAGTNQPIVVKASASVNTLTATPVGSAVAPNPS